jgi:hypothetical protein
MSRLGDRLRKLEEAEPERCDNCREWKEYVIRFDGRSEPHPTSCLKCGFEQSVILVHFTEEAGRL